MDTQKITRTWNQWIARAAFAAVLWCAAGGATVLASEAELALPSKEIQAKVAFNICGAQVSGGNILWVGIVVCLAGMVFGLTQYLGLKGSPTQVVKIMTPSCREGGEKFEGEAAELVDKLYDTLKCMEVV